MNILQLQPEFSIQGAVYSFTLPRNVAVGNRQLEPGSYEISLEPDYRIGDTTRANRLIMGDAIWQLTVNDRRLRWGLGRAYVRLEVPPGRVWDINLDLRLAGSDLVPVAGTPWTPIWLGMVGRVGTSSTAIGGTRQLIPSGAKWWSLVHTPAQQTPAVTFYRGQSTLPAASLEAGFFGAARRIPPTATSWETAAATQLYFW